MSDLAALQRRFAHLVLTGALEAADTAETPEANLADVSGHLHIYIHAYQGRMRQALSANYPVLHRALGDASFGALARAYCVAHPSQHPSIRWLGDGLVDFMAATPALLPHPALLDIARMDWAMAAAFDAADTACLRMQDLSGLAAPDWPALRLQPVASLQLLELQWGVEGLWHALHADANAHTAEPLPAPHAMLVWRQQLECRWRTLDAAEHLGLGLLQQGACFADLCQAVQQAGEPLAEQRVAHWLMAWISAGLLARDTGLARTRM
jgi:hypothetical protein